MRSVNICAAVLAAGLVMPSFAGDRVAVVPRVVPPHKTGAARHLRVDVKLVVIPVTVTDPFGAPVSGLPRDSFRLFEDGVEQELKYFTSEDAPVSLGVVFDASRSMQGKLDDSRAAIARFFTTAMPGDEFFGIEFNDAPKMLCKFTPDTEEIQKTLVSIQPKNWTALLDAVYMAIQHMKYAKNARKALLILSDGADNNSRYTESEMKAYVREADVCIYSIGLLNGGLMQRHVRLLRQLSEETGGLLHRVQKLTDLPEAVAKISAAIRNQYFLGYSSNNPQNKSVYRRIEVKLQQSPDLRQLRASWRSGYYEPAEQ